MYSYDPRLRDVRYRRHDPRLHPYASQVFVLGRMGLNREALQLMLEHRGDMARAIEFVQRAGDGELWQQLLSHAYRSAALAVALLEQVCRSPLMQLEPLLDPALFAALKNNSVGSLRQLLGLGLRAGSPSPSRWASLPSC